ATLAAGGVFTAGAALSVARSTLTGNSAELLGGALVGRSGATTIMGSTFNGNTASGEAAAASGGGGGGVFNIGATLNLTNDTFDRNATTGHGGAIAQALNTATTPNVRQLIAAAIAGVPDNTSIPLRSSLAPQAAAAA